MGRIQEITEKLNNSPLFNLSLSSKELFHSNFIDWLCNRYKDEMGSLFSEYIKNKSDNLSIIKCTRETKHNDLTIEYSTEKLIVENKVKSLPIESQLIKIEEKHEGFNFLLLTLIKPEFENDNWNILYYNDFASKLEIEFSNLEEGYEKSMILDYIDFIKNLSELINKLYKDFDESTLIINQTELKCLKDIRIHDIYLKYKYNWIAMQIIEKNRYKFDNVFYMGDNLYKINSLSVNTVMVNGKGWLGLNIPLNENLGVIIFIDGLRLGLGFYGDDVEKVKDIMNSHGKLLYDEVRFEFSDIVNEKKRTSKVYNKFDKGKTLYRWRNINQDLKVIDVIDNISNFIDITIKFSKEF